MPKGSVQFSLYAIEVSKVVLCANQNLLLSIKSNHILSFIITSFLYLFVVYSPKYSLLTHFQILQFSFVSFILSEFLLHPFLFLMVKLLKNLSHETCRVSYNLDFADCIQMVTKIDFNTYYTKMSLKQILIPSLEQMIL